MSEIDPEFLHELQQAFAVEAREQLQGIMTGLIQLESEENDDNKHAMTEEIMHFLHSLKGNSRAAGMEIVETLCQAFESALLSLRRRKQLLAPEAADVMLQAVDVIDQLITQMENGESIEESDKFKSVLEGLMQMDERRLRMEAEAAAAAAAAAAGTGDAPPVTQVDEIATKDQVVKPAAEEKSGARRPLTGTIDKLTGERSASIRMSLVRLDKLLREAEEMLVVKQMAEQHVTDTHQQRMLIKRLSNEAKRFSAALKERKQVSAAQLQQEVSTFANWLTQFSAGLEVQAVTTLRRQQQEQRVCGNLVDGFLDSVKSLLMQDFSGLLSVIPKVVRDLSRELDKDVDLEIFGTEIEIDRRILEGIKDPLIHLIRNSLDHGIENAADRVKAGKPKSATLRVGAVQTEDGHVELIVSDDGRGISTTRVKEAAVKAGAISLVEAQTMSRQEALELIYRSSFSTSEQVTEISGRGIGMAIVRENIHDLGGRIILETEEGVGTTFKLRMPIKLSTFRGIHVTAGGMSFIIPTLNVHYAGRIQLSDINTIGARNLITINNQLVSVQRLTDVLHIEGPSLEQSRGLQQLLVIGTNQEKAGFLVDEILQEHEVLVRGFAPPLHRVANFSGATILGTGQVVPVMNIGDLMLTSAKAQAANESLKAQLKTRESFLQRLARSPVFIIDRQATSRVLLRSFLEHEGYKVKTFETVYRATEQRADQPLVLLKKLEAQLDPEYERSQLWALEEMFGKLPTVLFGTWPAQRCDDLAIKAGAKAYFDTTELDRVALLKIIQKLT